MDKIYLKTIDASDVIPAAMPVQAACHKKWNSRFNLFVVDDHNRCVGLVSRKSILRNAYGSADDGPKSDIGMICAAAPLGLEVDSLSSDAAYQYARKRFEQESSLQCVEICDRTGVPLGYLYRGNNSIDQNRTAWDQNDGWTRADDGEAWSEAWGGSKAMWFGSILPRISAWLPCESILEIACGHGRWSRYLIPLAGCYRGVDLSESCAAFCEEQFSDKVNASFYANDGMTLPMIGDRSCDFVFSMDSLVHVEMDVMSSYIEECLRVLRPGGVAWLHHSNMAAFSHPFNEYWRAYTVCAESVREHIRKCGGTPLLQERISWGEIGSKCTDCITVFSNSMQPTRECEQITNEMFMLEASFIKTRINRYLNL